MTGAQRVVTALRGLGRRYAPALAVVLLLTAFGTGLATLQASAAQDPAHAGTAARACPESWVTAWQASTRAVPAAAGLAGRTLRMVVRPQVGGSQVRVRLSNRHGRGPLVVGPVFVAWSENGAELTPGTSRPVLFGGVTGTVVPAGGEVESDPVPLIVERGRALAVSMFVERLPAALSAHPDAMQTSYISRPGQFTEATSAAAFDVEVASWLVLSGLDVLASGPVNAVVAVGDSIVDGVGSGTDADQRWSDVLAERLTAAGGGHRMSVLNAGLSSTELLHDEPTTGIDSPLTRFPYDIAAGSGISDVVLHAGTNDIAAGRSAREIIAGLIRFTERAYAAGLRVFLTTITPASVGPHATEKAVAEREAVNAWVRTEGVRRADGVFDFAAAVADPARPTRLAAHFDAGDGLHLSAAGYRALAGAVVVDRLTGSPCLAVPSSIEEEDPQAAGRVS